ncbi:hypothetical protein M0R45_001144 [Rubus argutus]|uniref:NADH dehydrogenase subunit 6 n=1 Tax=Rubus argutus TaxID=59490 RepID=A0AAW1VIR2_RUBAR
MLVCGGLAAAAGRAVGVLVRSEAKWFHPIKVGVLHFGSVGGGSAVLMRWFWFLVVMVGVTQLCTWVSCGTLMVGDWFVGFEDSGGFRRLEWTLAVVEKWALAEMVVEFLGCFGSVGFIADPNWHG